MTPARIVGHYEVAAGERPLTQLELALVPLDCIAEWRRCGDCADFVARFLAYDHSDRDAAASTLSTIVNELVENAVKFSDDKHVPVRLCARRDVEHVRLDAANRTDAGHAARLVAVLEEIAGSDPDALFAARAAAPPAAGGPGLGLVLLCRCYGARLGARLSDADGHVRVEVQVTIPIHEVEPR